MKIYRCTKCGKEHTHRHIGFVDGCKHYDECFECCTHYGCIEAKKKGFVDKGGYLGKPEGDQQ